MGIVPSSTNAGGTASNDMGTAVTTGATASTKGSAAELISSTSGDSCWIRVMVSNVAASATASATAVDILIGAATEEVLIPDLLAGHAGTWSLIQRGPKMWDFPLYIPSGSRIAARAASERTSTAIRVTVWLYGTTTVAPVRVGSRVVTYGMGTVPQGTAITPGWASEGSWTQITASTSEDHFALIPSFQANNTTSLGNKHFQVDLGIGSATEAELGSFWFHTDAVEAMEGPDNSFPIFHPIPSGTRLAMRASGSTGSQGTYDAVIHAVS